MRAVKLRGWDEAVKRKPTLASYFAAWIRVRIFCIFPVYVFFGGNCFRTLTHTRARMPHTHSLPTKHSVLNWSIETEELANWILFFFFEIIVYNLFSLVRATRTAHIDYDVSDIIDCHEQQYIVSHNFFFLLCISVCWRRSRCQSTVAAMLVRI